MTKKQRLWEKGEGLNEMIHTFTVGNDPEVDLNLVDSDIYGSAAHARMLFKVGLLSDAEMRSLLAALADLLVVWQAGDLEIPRELEDCHTTIESYLVERCGEAGRKIHTGRSRNDQVLLVVRLYMRKKALEILGQLAKSAEICFVRAKATFAEPMPGYTHFQPAMPTTVGIWFHAFGEGLVDCIEQGLRVYAGIDSNPLGVGSGFGTTFPLDRKLVADLLGFSAVQRNAIDVQNSRGRHERRFVSWLCDIAAVVEKLALDLILFTTREFGFFSIPKDFTTGSSIMPQKHNPDVLELLRARAGKLRAAESEIMWITAKLPSHYHRDFQYTKEPVTRSVEHIQAMLPVQDEVIAGLSLHHDRLKAGMTADLFATYDAFREVKGGLAFRDAYRKTAERVHGNTLRLDILESDLNLVIDQARHELRDGEAKLQELGKTVKSLAEGVADRQKALLTPPKAER